MKGRIAGIAIALGIGILFAAIYWLGRAFIKRVDRHGRGSWDRPLAAPMPKDTVVAVYKRRKRWHRHHRHYYRHRRPRPD